MRGRTIKSGIVALCIAVTAAAAHGAENSEEAILAALAAPRPEIDVRRLPRAPTLEDFLDMEAPADLAPHLTRVGGFVQQSPEDGQPASQDTDVYLGYDDRHFYAVFVAFDAEPDKMRAALGRREQVFRDETVEIQLDTYRDQRRAFSFLTNPYGIQWDAIWTEGQGFDASWDTVWESRGRLTDRGYVVLMSIPFKSLRFTPDDEQVWGVVLVRDIPRNNETSFWPRVSNRIEGRLNQGATLRGLRGVTPGRNMWLIPYATSRSFRVLDTATPGFIEDDFDGDAGVDFKMVLRQGLALDLTANLDFSQVESDQPQITVNRRFEVFFPEKRPFFLENADYFQTPLNLLFTRRIAEPRGGARLTGKLGDYSLGAMVIDDEAPGKRLEAGAPGAAERATFGVLRLRRDVSEQSNIGLLVTDRRFDDDDNTVAGVDGRLKLNTNWDARFQSVYSRTHENEGTPDERRAVGAAHSLAVNRQGRKFTTHLHYEDIAPGFRTESGFINRTDIRLFHASSSYRFRPEGERLVSWGPSLFVEEIWDHDGLRQDYSVQPSMSWQLRRRTNFFLGGRLGRVRLRPGEFPIAAPLDYPVDNVRASFNTQFIDALGGGFGVTRAKAINFVPPLRQIPGRADQESANGNFTLKLGRRTRMDGTLLYTRLIDPASDRQIFANRISRIRLNWQYNPKLSLRAILQHVRTHVDPELTRLEDAENLNADLLLTYLVNPWTAIYVGYNGNYRNQQLTDGPSGPVVELTDGDLHNDARQIFIKASYLFRL